jgi:hypothetical protein
VLGCLVLYHSGDLPRSALIVSFLQYAEEPWKPLLITLLLLFIQRVVDNSRQK